ncbi:MAG: glycosyltransferase, partial [Thermodesulfobacteriota bacterium]|nr:glycosyltransferase [Thermodesulfobacteriota bacterium]
MTSKRAKILIVVDALPAGGTETQIVELFRGFKEKKGFILGLCVLKSGGHREMEARRYAHFCLPVRQHFEADVWTCFSLLKWARRHKIDLFHSFGARSDWIALFVAKLVGKPVINGSIRSARPKLNRIDLASRLSMPWADWVVSNSYAGLAAFGRSEFKKASVIHNGIDPGRFDQWRDVQGEPGRLCMVANFSRKKDQACLILALPLILRKISS